MLQVGLNPYGVSCAVGLSGPKEGAPPPLGLAGFLELSRDIGARSLELDIRLLKEASPEDQVSLGKELRDRGVPLILAIGMPGDGLGETIETAARVGAGVIRLDMTPVLCGDRAITANWDEILGTSREAVRKWAPIAAAKGLAFAIENHQDLGSEELMEIVEEAGPNVGICFDTGNPLAVGEDILSFALRVAPRVRHLHLKDYRVQFTDEGYRLVRCPIGGGCVPLADIEAILSNHHDRLTASLEPGALEARHVRLFTANWWKGYPTRPAQELGQALLTARRNRLEDDEDWRTPWEQKRSREEVVDHELHYFSLSVDNMKAMGWL